MSSRALVGSLSLFAAIALATPLVSPAAHAETLVPAKDPADALMKKLLDALKANDYAAFVADGTPRHRTLSKGAFGLVSAHLGPMLMKGYKTTVLTILRKPDHSIHLWKLEPAGAEEDFELKLVLKNGKVDAFSIL
jgi:hypothetical protein